MSPQPTGTDGVGPSVPVIHARVPGRRAPRHRCVLAVAALGATFALGAGCGRDTTTSATPPAPTVAPATTATPSTTTTTTAPPATTAPAAAKDDEAQVRDVIDTYWKEWTLALREADAGRPTLVAILDGDAKERVVAQLQKNQALNEIALRSDELPTPHRTLTVTISGDSATVRECVVDDAVLLERTTGQTLNTAVDSFVLEKKLNRQSSGWKISESSQLNKVEGGELCAGA